MSLDLPRMMRQEFHSLIELIGLWVIYGRTDRRFRCRDCFNLDTLDGRTDCGTCFGTGYPVTLERWKMHYSTGLQRIKPNQAPLTPIGYGLEMGQYFFSRYTEIPQEGDRVFLVEWDKPRDRLAKENGQPRRLINAFRVNFVDHNTAAEVIYHTLQCEVLDESRAAYQRALLSRPVTVSRL